MFFLKRLWRRRARKGSRAGLGHGCAPLAAEQFDAAWYLQTYPDVAAAGADPWAHYCNHGRFEGRLPCRNRAISWEFHLWRGGAQLLLPRLQQLAETPDAAEQERDYAAWAVARWFAAKYDWPTVLQYLKRFQRAAEPNLLLYPGHAGPYLLLLEAACFCEQWEFARDTLEVLKQRFPAQTDTMLAEADLLGLTPCEETQIKLQVQRRLDLINQIFTAQGLCSLAAGNDGALNLDSLCAVEPLPIVGDVNTARVSVIVPAYNAERTLITALTSLCCQSWRNLQILVVDDASTDSTWQVLENFVQATQLRPGLEILPLRHASNRGAYASRNTGLANATGDLIATHDSDDWSHPQKIELQVKALMQASGKAGCTSHWVRSTDALHFSHWRPEDSWVHRNVSSLMVRRSVVDTLGFWDEVSVNADTEYYYRVLKAFGEDALVEVLPGTPLAFGRSDTGSLSRRSETHLSTRFFGVRKDYEDAGRRWHQRALDRSDLYLPAGPVHRPFLAPGAICREQKEIAQLEPRDLVQQSGLFDCAWYLQQYPDLQDQPVDLFEHFWENGLAEDRDPGPAFSVSGYLLKYPEVAASGLQPLFHYLTVGKVLGYKPRPVFEGLNPQPSGSFRLMVCAHQAGAQLYGAERSLLDVLSAFSRLGVDLVVTLPCGLNAGYVESVRQIARAVVVLPYGWWNAQQPSCAETESYFADLIAQYGIQALYANTLVLDEPLRAARAAGIPTMIHVRELPYQDQALCDLLGATPEVISERVRQLADVVLVNSEAVKRSIAAPEAVVVPNAIDTNRYTLPDPQPDRQKTGSDAAVTVAMISSNLPKKGLDDFVGLVELLSERCPSVRCQLIGPDNEHVARLRQRQADDPRLGGLEFSGYSDRLDQFLPQVDVVVNLSHFQESFGRTALEAMAAGKPVVGYDWGALPEVVVDGVTGHLVPLGDVNAVADRIVRLVENSELREIFGSAGSRRAAEYFSPPIMQRQLGIALRRLGVTSTAN